MSSPTESTTEQMVSLIDNIKGDIPDQKYIEIMDKLKELNEEEKTYKYIITHTCYRAMTICNGNDIKIKVNREIKEILVELKEPLQIDSNGIYECLGDTFLYYCINKKNLSTQSCRCINSFDEDEFDLEVELPQDVIINVRKLD